MQISQVALIHFSPTGGTRRVARALAAGMDLPCHEIDLTQTDQNALNQAVAAAHLGPRTLCVIAVPSYGGRVPAPALRQLGQIDGSASPAMLVAVYGNRAFDDTLLELQEAAQAAGFATVAGVGAIAEHSLARQFATGRPDADDAVELAGFAQVVLNALATADAPRTVTMPGNTPYRTFNGVPLKPSADRSCIKCGLCARQCPAGAIDPEHPNKTNANTCISCMRCVEICPVHARSCNGLLMAGIGQKLKKACSDRKPNELFV